MVYVDPKELGYEPYWRRWMNKWNSNKEKYETLSECLEENYNKYVTPLIKLIYDGEDGEEIG